MSDQRKARWTTRFGFYLLAIGSAFGLGNIWRFPYIVAENGGGAFLFVYLAMVFLVGMPFLIGELFLGKVTGSAVIPAMRRLGEGVGDGVSSARSSRFHILMGSGYLAIALCLMVLAYYSVVCGWVLHFLMRFVVAALGLSVLDPGGALHILLNNGWLQIMLTSVHLLLIMVVITRGVEEGIERWVGKVIPVFLILVVALAFRSLSMDSSTDALRFFLYPDFSRLTPAALGQAIGQVCFTLSVGFGTMVTFGSYTNENVSVPATGFRVAVFDSLVSLVAGMMIFPLVFSRANADVGPTLLFETVPFMFARLPGGVWFGVGFFLCLYLAALGASLGLLETAVANLRETRKKMSRPRATIIAVVMCLYIAVIPALSSSVLKGNTIMGMTVMEAWDGFLINWLLPITAVLISQIVVRRVDREVQQAEFDKIPSASMGRLYAHWRFAIRYLAPILCVLGLALQLV
ncbi:MAG: sodium-dependent transporter [Bdellovibrionales bacterium]